MAIVITLLISILILASGLATTFKLADAKTRFGHTLIASIGAGILLTVLIFEFMPRVLRTNEIVVYIFFIIGLVSLYTFEKTIQYFGSIFPNSVLNHTSCPREIGVFCGSTGCLMICSFFDGLEIIGNFALNPHVGLVASMAIAIHAAPNGVLVASFGLNQGLKRNVVIILVTITAFLFLSGGLLGNQLVNAKELLTPFIGFTAGLLSYIVFFHLLPKVRYQHHGYYVVASAALISYLLLSLIQHHGH